MAKRKNGAKTGELVPADPIGTALVLPSFIDKEDTTGKEGIESTDITLPRLAIAQGLTHELVPDSSSHIENLRLFDLFNSLTQEIYGRGPLTFIPINRRKIIIEFDPDDRSIPLDLDVPFGDPRTEWTTDADGRGVPPKATTFIEFVVLLLQDGRDPEPLVISIKQTNKWQRKAAERLTMFMVSTPGPAFSSFKTVECKSEKNDEGTFGVYAVKNKGMMKDGDEKLYHYAKQFASMIDQKTIVVERETGGTDTNFDTDAMEAEGGAQEM